MKRVYCKQSGDIGTVYKRMIDLCKKGPKFAFVVDFMQFDWPSLFHIANILRWRIIQTAETASALHRFYDGFQNFASKKSSNFITLPEDFTTSVLFIPWVPEPKI